jgi:hypothetical protein
MEPEQIGKTKRERERERERESYEKRNYKRAILGPPREGRQAKSAFLKDPSSFLLYVCVKYFHKLLKEIISSLFSLLKWIFIRQSFAQL